MLSDDARTKEIERRKRAGSGQIPISFPGERIVTMEGFASTVYLFSQQNIFRVRTADDIDPDVSRANVPWSINKYLSIGTQHQLIASSFGILKEIRKTGPDTAFLESASKYLLEFAVCAAEMEYARKIYQDEVAQAMEQHQEGFVISGSAAQVPRIEHFEISFSIYFSAAKRAISKIVSLLELAAGFPPTGGTHIDKFCNRVRSTKKLRDHHALMDRLEGFKKPIHLINEIRNSFEHPSGAQSVLLHNITMLAGGQLRMPTFTLLHKDFSLAEYEDYGALVENSMSTTAKFVETAVLVAAILQDRGLFQWQATVKSQDRIDLDYPTRWQIEFIVPQTD